MQERKQEHRAVIVLRALLNGEIIEVNRAGYGPVRYAIVEDQFLRGAFDDENEFYAELAPGKYPYILQAFLAWVDTLSEDEITTIANNTALNNLPPLLSQIE